MGLHNQGRRKILTIDYGHESKMYMDDKAN